MFMDDKKTYREWVNETVERMTEQAKSEKEGEDEE